MFCSSDHIKHTRKDNDMFGQLRACCHCATSSPCWSSDGSRIGLTSKALHYRRTGVSVEALKQKEGLDVAWLQTVDEVHILVPTEEGVHKSDLSFQVHPQRLSLTVKGESLLSGDLPEAVDVDGSFWAFEDTRLGRSVLITLLKKEMGHESWPSPLETAEARLADPAVTHRTFMEIAVGGKPVGKVTFALYGNSLPRTVENFRALCTGEKGSSPSSGVPLSYKGSSFHRIIPSFMAQGGDFTNGDGTGGQSIYGDKFDDEGFQFSHDKPGKLSMANSGPDTNGSQFFITYAPQTHLDGKHVVFGHVDSGMQTLKDLAKLGSRTGRVKEPVTVLSCGLVDADSH